MWCRAPHIFKIIRNSIHLGLGQNPDRLEKREDWKYQDVKQINRQQVELGAYIFQRPERKNPNLWYAGLKMKGIPRQYITLGEMTQETAVKTARQELLKAETAIREFGVTAILGKHTTGTAIRWFYENWQEYVTPTRFKTMDSHLRINLKKYFPARTPIDRRLRAKMMKYPDWRRKVDKRTGKKRKAANSTILSEMATMRQVLNYAHIYGGIGIPASDLELTKQINSRFKRGKSKTVTFTDAEIVRIQNAFNKDRERLDAKLQAKPEYAGVCRYQIFLLERLRFFTALCFAAGLRVDECRNLQHNSIARDYQTLSPPTSKTVLGKKRIAYINNDIWDIQEAYKRWMKLCPTGQGNRKSREFIFRNLQDEHAIKHPGAAFRKFLRRHRMLYGSDPKRKEEGENAGRRYPRNYLATRHYFITKMVDLGLDPFTLARSCGNSHQMIERIYYEKSAKAMVESVHREIATDRRARFKALDGGRLAAK